MIPINGNEIVHPQDRVVEKLDESKYETKGQFLDYKTKDNKIDFPKVWQKNQNESLALSNEKLTGRNKKLHISFKEEESDDGTSSQQNRKSSFHDTYPLRDKS